MSKKKSTPRDNAEETPTVVLPATNDSAIPEVDETSVLPATDLHDENPMDPTKVAPEADHSTPVDDSHAGAANATAGSMPNGMPYMDSTQQPQPAAPRPSAQTAYTAAPSIPEAPFNSVRIGLLIWAVIVAVIGLMMTFSAFFTGISFGVLITTIIGGCGVVLILGAAFSALRSR